MNLNKKELFDLRAFLNDARTTAHTDPRVCCRVLEDAIALLHTIEEKHYKTLKKIADRGLENARD